MVVWYAMYRDPADHPAVTSQELAQLQQDYPKTAGARIGWGELFGYRMIWGMMIGFFCLNFVIYFFTTWFPSYLTKSRGFSLAKLGTLGLLPGLVAIPAGWLGGWLSDHLYRRGWSLTAARKTCLVGGMLISSVGRARRRGAGRPRRGSACWPCPTRGWRSPAPTSGRCPATWRRPRPTWPRSAASRTSPRTSPASP